MIMTAKAFADENLPPHLQEMAERMNTLAGNIPPWEVPGMPFAGKTSPGVFLNESREKLKQPFYDHVFGKIPPRCEELLIRKIAEKTAFQGLAIRREIDIVCRHKGMEQIFHLLCYIPAKRKKKVPVFLGLNFGGNHGTTLDPEVPFYPFTPYPSLIPGSLRWKDRRFTEEERGKQAHRWVFEKVLKAGFASATINYYDIFPDHPHGFPESIMRFFYTEREWESPDRDSGAISAWAWGLMRAIDALETQEELDMSRLIVHGHSRLGKTALWAGANDPRIAMTVANGSGAGGAKLMHHYFGENFEWLHYWNNYWFRGNFHELIGKDESIPWDFHYLLASIAPRLVYVADGKDDVYADAVGEYLACKEASKAWEIFGASGIGEDPYPAPGSIAGKEIGFFLRHGEHDFTPENWDALLGFARLHFPEEE